MGGRCLSLPLSHTRIPFPMSPTHHTRLQIPFADPSMNAPSGSSRSAAFGPPGISFSSTAVAQYHTFCRSKVALTPENTVCNPSFETMGIFLTPTLLSTSARIEQKQKGSWGLPANRSNRIEKIAVLGEFCADELDLTLQRDAVSSMQTGCRWKMNGPPYALVWVQVDIQHHKRGKQ